MSKWSGKGKERRGEERRGGGMKEVKMKERAERGKKGVNCNIYI